MSKMKLSSLLLFSMLSIPSHASEDEEVSLPPPRPEKIEPVEGECEISYPLVKNRPVPVFFVNEDGTINCNALLVPRSQAGYAILMAEWAENLNEWYQLDIEIRDAEMDAVLSAHKLEIETIKRKTRNQGIAIGSGSVGVLVIIVLAAML